MVASGHLIVLQLENHVGQQLAELGARLQADPVALGVQEASDLREVAMQSRVVLDHHLQWSI